MSGDADQRHRVAEALASYSAAQSELGRVFAKRMRMHVSDSRAMVEIIRAESRGHPLTPGRLAERIGLTRGATSILLNRLEAAGHINRQRGHADRRVVTLHCSEAVHAASREFFAPLRDQMDTVMRACTPDELALLERVVGELRATLDAYLGRHPQDGADPSTGPGDRGAARA